MSLLRGMQILVILARSLSVGYVLCSDVSSRSCRETRRQAHSIRLYLKEFLESRKRILSGKSDIEYASLSGLHTYKSCSDQSSPSQKNTFNGICERSLSYYREVENNINYSLSNPQIDLSVNDFIDINGLLGFDYIFNTHLTEKKYHRAHEKVKRLVKERIPSVNTEKIFQYLIILLLKPSKRDLIVYRRFPELVGMLVDLMNKYKALSLEDIVLVLVHLSVIKSNVYYTLGKYSEQDIMVFINTHEFGRNYSFKPGIYKHVEEIYKLLNGGSDSFIREYITCLENIKERYKNSQVDTIISDYRMILFIVNPISVNLIKKFFDESVIVESKVCKFKLENEECVVCLNMFMTVVCTFRIILHTLKEIYGTSNSNVRFKLRFLEKYNHFLGSDDVMIYRNISDLVSLIYDTLSMHL